MEFFNPNNNQNQFQWLSKSSQGNKQNKADAATEQKNQTAPKNSKASESNKSDMAAYYEATKQLANEAKKEIKQMKTKLFAKMKPALNDMAQTRKAVKNSVKEEFNDLNDETADYLTDMTLQHRMDQVGVS